MIKNVIISLLLTPAILLVGVIRAVVEMSYSFFGALKDTADFILELYKEMCYEYE